MKLVKNFHHTPGAHCGTTAMSDLLCFFGLDVNEAMSLGLGRGLSFSYHCDPRGQSPSHAIYGRTLTLEHDLCGQLALDYAEGTDDDSDRAWQTAKSWVDLDLPVLLHVELSGMPYYRTRTRFPGHRALLVGYDDALQIAFLADTHFPDLQTITYADLGAARVTHAPPILLRNDWLAICSTRGHKPLAEAIQSALRDNAREMLAKRSSHWGIQGMETLAEDFELWPDFPDWDFCARFSYQNIEVRGTGGGFFRKLHAQFLRQAESMGAINSSAKFADEMQEIASAWSAFGAILKQIAEEKNAALFAQANNAIRQIAKREEHFWGRVLDLVGTFN